MTPPPRWSSQPNATRLGWERRRCRARTSDRRVGCANFDDAALRNAAAQLAPWNRRDLPRRRQCRCAGRRAVTLAQNLSKQFEIVGARHAVPLQFTMTDDFLEIL